MHYLVSSIFLGLSMTFSAPAAVGTSEATAPDWKLYHCQWTNDAHTTFDCALYGEYEGNESCAIYEFESPEDNFNNGKC